MRKYFPAVLLCASVCAFAAVSHSQDKPPQSSAPEKIDFVRDVQPILKSRCIGCHGPREQKNGFRLDRRKDAMRGGTIAVIGPYNADGSRLYNRLIGDQYGIQMPPTGALPAEQLKIIKEWIDQGAVWPDSASGEVPPTPPDSQAVRMMDALRNGDRPAFQSLLKGNHEHVNGKGLGGSTPLMYAALYGDLDSMQRLLAAGANPNLADEAGATPLMFAAYDLEKTRLLVEHGADVNAKSDIGRTPLLIASGRYGSSPVVKLLLDHGADANAHATSLFGPMTPLAEAAFVGDKATVQLLLDRGADLKAAGPLPLGLAVAIRNTACADLLSRAASKEDYSMGLVFNTPPNDDAWYIKTLLDRGADPNTKDPFGNSVFMLTAATDTLQLDSLKALAARGADIHAKNPAGLTALDYAMLRGNTPVVDFLLQSGVKPGAPPVVPPAPKPAESVHAAVERSLPLLQHTDVTFAQKSGCISCHNNTFTAQTVSAARTNHYPIDESIAKSQLKYYGSYIEDWRDRALQGVGIPGDTDTMSYILIALAAERYPADPATDAMARFILDRQSPVGYWTILAHRPPIESSNIEVTAVGMRSLQLYGIKTQRAEYDRAIAIAAKYLDQAQAKSNEDHVFQLFGLEWAGAKPQRIHAAAQALLAAQNSDGGWSQLPTIPSDAYATGQALVALVESGALKTSDAVYKRGAEFLRTTQLADGSWFVRSRAIPLQPYFESGFPHGHDQFISAAGTNWATHALALAAREAPRTQIAGSR